MTISNEKIALFPFLETELSIDEINQKKDIVLPIFNADEIKETLKKVQINWKITASNFPTAVLMRERLIASYARNTNKQLHKLDLLAIAIIEISQSTLANSPEYMINKWIENGLLQQYGKSPLERIKNVFENQLHRQEQLEQIPFSKEGKLYYYIVDKSEVETVRKIVEQRTNSQKQLFPREIEESSSHTHKSFIGELKCKIKHFKVEEEKKKK